MKEKYRHLEKKPARLWLLRVSNRGYVRPSIAICTKNDIATLTRDTLAFARRWMNPLSHGLVVVGVEDAAVGRGALFPSRRKLVFAVRVNRNRGHLSEARVSPTNTRQSQSLLTVFQA